MAMIKCPECGKEVSDKATTCPNCGTPLGNENRGGFEQPIYGQAPQPPKKKKKHKGLIVFAVIVVLIIIIAAVGSGGSSDSDQKSADSQTTEETKGEDTADAAEDDADDVDSDSSDASSESSDDFAKYQQISIGQSLQDVEGILGASETVSSSTEVGGVKSEIYSWSIGLGASVTVSFTDGAVSAKGQVGLTAPDAVTIDTDKFNAINTGMTYDEVVAAVGGPGTEDSYTEILGSTSVSYIWSGDSLGSNATVTFTDGKVSNKAQFGL